VRISVSEDREDQHLPVGALGPGPRHCNCRHSALFPSRLWSRKAPASGFGKRVSAQIAKRSSNGSLAINGAVSLRSLRFAWSPRERECGGLASRVIETVAGTAHGHSARNAPRTRKNKGPLAGCPTGMDFLAVKNNLCWPAGQPHPIDLLETTCGNRWLCEDVYKWIQHE
jgi:hypothetical protein